jgi:ribonuclease HII
MEKYHHIYPDYNFKKNKGYGTQEHLKALRQYGFCSLHRKSFRGVIPIPELF